ncbi:hypothetical protein [Nitrosomonas oligotropha]
MAVKEVAMENEDQLVHAVDNALYAAKNAGRKESFWQKAISFSCNIRYY